MSALVRRLKAPIGLSDISRAGIQPTGEAWDVFIDDIPFMLDPSPNFPFHIKAIGQTLYRYDTSNQAGEQTLGAWWLRSQTSFHGGAGQTNLDGTDPSISSEIASLRFNNCRGVDVWTPGAVKLLSDVTKPHATTNAGIRLLGGLSGTTPVIYFSDGTSLFSYAGSVSSLTRVGTGTISAMTQNGAKFYTSDEYGTYYGGFFGGGESGLLWDTSVTSGVVALSWLKQRLMAATATSLYELDGGKVTTIPTPSNVTWLPSRANSTAYKVGDAIIGPTAAHWFKCTTAGTSAASAPTFNTTSGSTTTDGTVVWTEQGTVTTYYYALTVVTATGETTIGATASSYGPSTLSALGTYPIKFNWTVTDGAVSYNVFGRASGTPLKMANVIGTSFTDDGSITPAGAPPATNTTATLPTPKFTLPTGWTFDCVADGPEAIYAAAHSGPQSVVYKFVLDGSGGVPTLSTGITALTLPHGTVVTSLQNHSDSWLAIGTNKGLFIGQFQSGGDIAIDLLGINLGGTVTALTAHDRFIYATYTDSDGLAAIARVDLSLQIKNGLYAWAPDLRTTDVGSVTALALLGDKVAFAVDGHGVYVQSDAYVPSGTLTASRVRFDTSEAKIFNSVRWHGVGPGTVECDVAVDSDSGGRNVGVLSVGGGFDSTDTPILLPGGGFATMTFTLATTDTTKTPTLSGWLLKALPMQSRSYQIMLPLSCYDDEKLGNGRRFGHTGFSLERVDAIMQMASEQKAHVLQQIAGPKDQRRAMRVVIDDLEYIQTIPPRTESRTGGLLYLTLRTVYG